MPPTDPKTITVANVPKESEPKAPEPKVKKMTAEAILAFMKETGTGESRLRVAQNFIAKNPKATGEELYDHLVEQKIPDGTLVKVCKQLYGAEAMPKHLTQGTPDEEVLSLRRENERLRDQLSRSEAEKAMYKMHMDHQGKQMSDVVREAELLRATQAKPLDFQVTH